MSMRTVSLGILSGIIAGTAVGCSGQPTAPSSTASNATVGSATTMPEATTAQDAAVSPSRFGDRSPGVVFVTSQGLYYDTFVVKDPLPPEGKFQILTSGRTEFGPGQPGYLGGRWWEDLNANGIQDSADHYFLCPLLPPGRPTP
jgi:hypothetical protein